MKNSIKNIKNIVQDIIRCLMILSFLILAGCSSMNSYWNSGYDTGTRTGNATTSSPPKQIALLLPLSGPMGGPGRAVRDGFMASYYQAVQSGQADAKVQVYDTTQGDVERLYEKAILDGADCVVGPLEKEKVERVVRSPVPVTTLVLNYPAASYSSSPNLYEFGLSPLDEAVQAAQYAYQSGHRSAMIIAPAGSWGSGVAQAFQTEWQKLGGHVVTRYFYSPNQDLTSYIRQMLQVNDSEEHEQRMGILLGRRLRAEEHRRQDADMIFMVALPPKARQINPLLKFYYAGDLPVYSISLVYSGIPAPLYDQDLNDIIFDDMPWVFSPEALKLSNFPRLYGLGMDAFTVVMQRNQWKYSPNSTIQGNTGVLHLNPGNRISRQLIWAEFEQGEARTL